MPAPATLAPYRPALARHEQKSRRRRILTLAGGLGFIYGFLVSIFPIAFYVYMAMPLLVGILLVIWVLPEQKHYPWTVMERLLFALVIGIFIWPNYLAIQIPGLPWITVLRLVAFPLTLIALVSLSISKAFRDGVKSSFRASPWLAKLMVGFVLIQTLTLPFSNRVGLSFNRYMDAQLQATIPFFIAAFLFTKPQRFHWFAAIICAMAAYLCLLAIPELYNNQALWVGHIPSFIVVGDERVGAILAGGRRAATGTYRVQSTFSTSLGFAEFLALAMPWFIYFFTLSKNAVMRAAILAYVPLCFWVILATNSRLGVVGFFVSFLAYGLLWGIKRWISRRESLFAPFLVLAYPAIATMFLILTFAWQRLQRMVWGGGAEAASTDSRKLQYEMGFDKILQWPFGKGIGTGGETLGFQDLMGFTTIDSYYLVVALEYGVLGFFVYFGLMTYGIVQSTRFAMRTEKREGDALIAAAVVLTVFVIVKGVLAQDDNHGLIFMMLGMVAGLTYRVDREQPKVIGSEAK